MIEVTGSDGVRVITFDRPEARNAFNFAMYSGVSEAIEAAAADDDVHALVLTGRGSAFSAGQDLGEMARIAAGEPNDGIAGGFPALIEVLLGCPKPVLAAVNGVAVGLGLTLLAHCDVVLIDETARLRAPFAELGVPPEAGSSYLLPARLGWQQAARVLLCADWISAKEAVDAGIALRACAEGTVLDETIEVARRLAGYAPEAVQEIKRLMRAPERSAVDDALRRENDAFSRLLGRAANQQALSRFATRRK
jgi:enoyl-CoA hydratase/carnithine racemase